MYRGQSEQQGGGAWKIRIVIALVLAAFAFFRYASQTQVNPTTGEKQHVAMSPDEEVALGMRAAPRMIQEHGGEVTSGQAAELVQEVGAKLVESTAAARSPYRFQFHLLDDPETVNAFALPGGQVFITTALLNRLDTEGQLAGVLGHEIGHVIARHGAQQLAKQQLTQGLASSAAVGAGGDSGHVAAQIGAILGLKYGRKDELEADQYGVKYCVQSGYDPHAMLGVMKVLGSLDKGGRQPEMLSTHPNPENRAERIEQILEKEFPSGVPKGLVP